MMSKLAGFLVTGALMLSSSAQEFTLRDGGEQRIFTALDGQTRKSVDVPQLALYPKTGARNQFTRRILQNKVLIKVGAEVNAVDLANQAGAVHEQAVAYAPGFHILRTRGALHSIRVSEILRSEPGVISADPILLRKLKARAVPNDPLFAQQWTLKNTGQDGGLAGMDINVVDVWDRYRGTGVIVGVVDDGLLYTHPDLAANYIASMSIDIRGGDMDPAPDGEAGADAEGKPLADSHGTATAGVLAARANNSLGGSGVAPEASLVAIRLIGGDTGDDQEGDALAHQLNAIQVSNNSWGGDDDAKTKVGLGALAEQALMAGTTQGRQGKGVVYVWAAGNGGEVGDNANYDAYANSVYVVGVGALNDLGEKASYSEPGACLTVVAPAGNDSTRPQGSITTDLLGDFGYNRSDVQDDIEDIDYTATYNGTSSAAPVVSGVAALMLQANPALGWRDVKEILIRSASKVSPNDSDWKTNGAGFQFNHKFGAGLVNAKAAVDMAKTWSNLSTQKVATIESGPMVLNIPAQNNSGAVKLIKVVNSMRVEQARVTIDITHAQRGDLAINLISPSGTISRLAEPHADPNPNYANFRFTSSFHWGEPSLGDWKVQVINTSSSEMAVLTSVKLELFGAEDPNTSVPPTKLEVVALVDGRFVFRVKGNSGTYEVQGSFDLVAWEALGTSEAGVDLEDEEVAQQAARYFRAVRVR